MKTSNNIIAASKLALPFHVVSPNEVHSFDNKQEAESEHWIYGGTYNYNFIYYHNSPQTNTESILTFRKVLIYHFGIFSTSL